MLSSRSPGPVAAAASAVVVSESVRDVHRETSRLCATTSRPPSPLPTHFRRRRPAPRRLPPSLRPRRDGRVVAARFRVTMRFDGETFSTRPKMGSIGRPGAVDGESMIRSRVGASSDFPDPSGACTPEKRRNSYARRARREAFVTHIIITVRRQVIFFFFSRFFLSARRPEPTWFFRRHARAGCARRRVVVGRVRTQYARARTDAIFTPAPPSRPHNTVVTRMTRNLFRSDVRITIRMTRRAWYAATRSC